MLVYLKLGEISFNAKAGSHEKILPDEKAYIWFNMQKTYLFDAATEKVI
jgi:hypothetical protein